MHELYKHQIDACRFAVEQGGRAALFMDVGTGKCLTTLELFKYFKSREPDLKLFVLAPISLLESSWHEDCARFMPQFRFQNTRQSTIDYKADIFVMNYEKLLTRAGNDILGRLLTQYNVMCVLDESVRIANHAAKITKTLMLYRGRFKYKLILSGCPAPQGLEQYYSQISFIRDGVFNGSFYAFRNHFCHLAGRDGKPIFTNGARMTREIASQMFRKGIKYVMSDQKKAEMMALIKPFCFFLKKEDALDLPEQVDQVRLIPMGTEQEKIYKQMKNELLIELKGNVITAPLALTKLQKLQQIANGFCLDQYGKGHEIQNPKLQELQTVLAELGDEQVIIWINFRHEAVQLLNILGEKATLLNGEVSDKEKPIREFKAGEKQYLIAHPKSASCGLTLTNSSTQIFWSMSYSYGDAYQCRGRTMRIGQKKMCLYIHLIMDKTIEQTIHKVVYAKKEANEIVYAFMKGE